MTLDFVIAGFPKCGTTSLYHWLKTHPDIFMPHVKEPHYYAPHLSDRYCRIRDKQTYLSLFANAEPFQLTGEASVLYAYYPVSIQAILSENPETKFVLLLRDPVTMVPSYHNQMLLNLDEDREDFEQAWHEPRGDRSALCDYRWAGSLGTHLQAIQNLVPPEQLHILFLEDMISAPAETYHAVLKFLKVTPDARKIFPVVNEAAQVRFRWVQQLGANDGAWIKPLKRIIRPMFSNRKPKLPNSIPPLLRQELQQTFHAEKLLVRDLIGRVPDRWNISGAQPRELVRPAQAPHRP